VLKQTYIFWAGSKLVHFDYYPHSPELNAQGNEKEGKEADKKSKKSDQKSEGGEDDEDDEDDNGDQDNEEAEEEEEDEEEGEEEDKSLGKGKKTIKSKNVRIFTINFASRMLNPGCLDVQNSTVSVTMPGDSMEKQFTQFSLFNASKRGKSSLLLYPCFNPDQTYVPSGPNDDGSCKTIYKRLLSIVEENLWGDPENEAELFIKVINSGETPKLNLKIVGKQNLKESLLQLIDA